MGRRDSELVAHKMAGPGLPKRDRVDLSIYAFRHLIPLPFSSGNPEDVQNVLAVDSILIDPAPDELRQRILERGASCDDAHFSS